MIKQKIVLTGLCLVATALIAAPLQAAEPVWGTDYQAAAQQAKASGKLILADFTGSDWCGWCIRLKKEVFTTPEFQKWAAEKVILLELDFPKRKHLDARTKAQNQSLARKYGIGGFPTILLLDADGNVAGRTGYVRGGPKPWIARADGLIAAYVKANTLALAKDLATGQAAAKTQKRPLLVVMPGSDAEADAFTKGLLADKKFIALANSGLIVVHVKPGDAETLTALKQTVTIDDKASLVILDVKADAPSRLYSADGEATTEKILKGVNAAMPAIEYKGEWLTDYAKAAAIARQQNKAILTDFTGSDWCGWCIRLKREVFRTKEFKTWAANHVVLLELDFPKRKAQPAEVTAQNRQLAKKYNVRGFPTILFLTPDGAQIGKTGYLPGGPKAWIANANKVLAKYKPAG